MTAKITLVGGTTTLGSNTNFPVIGRFDLGDTLVTPDGNEIANTLSVINLSIPRIVINKGQYDAEDINGNPLHMYNSAYVEIRDLDPRLLADPQFDCRVELLRYQGNGRKHNNVRPGGRYVHPNNMDKDSGQIDPTYSNDLFRGGFSSINRQTEWPVYGMVNYGTINNGNPIPVEEWFRKASIEVRPQNSFDGTGLQSFVPVASGGNGRLNTMVVKNFSRTPGYQSKFGPIKQRFKFRLSIAVPGTDGKKRIVGPESSETLVVSAFPYPVLFDFDSGKLRLIDSDGLKSRIE